ncbi:hypothetical protein JL722_6736 [Aureococcus anophagefferens]|nr:hypothetical protein JL722_6736 [Aureococcus anophagefferens]
MNGGRSGLKKEKDVRLSNIMAAKAIADVIRTLCKKVKKAGVTVLLIQKSILRDAYNDLSLHFLAKMGILVVADVERGDVAYIADTLGLLPVARGATRG